MTFWISALSRTGSRRWRLGCEVYTRKVWSWYAHDCTCLFFSRGGLDIDFQLLQQSPAMVKTAVCCRVYRSVSVNSTHIPSTIVVAMFQPFQVQNVSSPTFRIWSKLRLKKIFLFLFLFFILIFLTIIPSSPSRLVISSCSFFFFLFCDWRGDFYALPIYTFSISFNWWKF